MAAQISVTEAFLAVGDTDQADAVDLLWLDAATGAACFIEEGSFKAPPPSRRTFRSYVADGSATNPSQARLVSFDLYTRGQTADHLYDLRAAIERKLEQAEKATDGQGNWITTPVVLRVRSKGTTGWTYFDVLTGSLTEKQRDFGPAPIMRWTVDLTCRLYARGDAYWWTPDGDAIVWGGLDASLYIPDVKGDVAALAEWHESDVSTTGAVNGIRRFVRSGHALKSLADFTPFLQVQPATGAALVNDGSSWGDGNFARIIGTSTLTAIGDARGINVGAFTRGTFDVTAYVRESTSLLNGPLFLTAQAMLGGGTLTGYLGIAVTAIDRAGNESPAAVATASLYAAGSVKLTWAPPERAVSHRIYLLPSESSGSVGSYFVLNSANGSYTLTSAPGPNAGSPPPAKSINVLSALWQAQVGYDLDDQPLWQSGKEQPTPLGGNGWTPLYLGAFTLPPGGLLDDATDASSFRIRIRGRSRSVGSPTLDVAFVALAAIDEAQMFLVYPNYKLASPRTWISGTRRDGVPVGAIQSGSAGAALLAPRGQSLLSPGGNVVAWELVGQDGYAAPGLGLQPSVKITPRYLDMAGSR